MTWYCCKRIIQISKWCIAFTILQLPGQKCCYNGCLNSCVDVVRPPPLIDWQTRSNENPIRDSAGNLEDLYEGKWVILLNYFNKIREGIWSRRPTSHTVDIYDLDLYTLIWEMRRWQLVQCLRDNYQETELIFIYTIVDWIVIYSSLEFDIIPGEMLVESHHGVITGEMCSTTHDDDDLPMECPHG